MPIAYYVSIINNIYELQKKKQFLINFKKANNNVKNLLCRYLFVNSNETDQLNAEFEKIIFVRLLWVIIFIYKTFIICQSCHRSSKEAKHIGFYLHQFGFNTHILQEKTQVKLFSLKVLHQKVVFMPCGLFQVDLKLMFTVCININLI